MQPGSTLGSYEIRESLGKGGMGEVYRAFDPRLEREVAVKVLPAELAAQPELRARFAREAKALAALRHSGIVTVFSVEESDGVHFLTMELVEGTTLEEHIPPAGMKLDRFYEVAVQLTEALAAAHERGIVHRDLKPSNILVDDAGAVTLLDFGLVKRLASSQTSDDGATQALAEPTALGVVLGTLQYMSPEQARGEPVDARSDVFSLGAVFYQMLTGRRPFEAPSQAATVAAILHEREPALGDRRPDVAEELAALIARCLEKDPARRFASGTELRERLPASTLSAVPATSAGVRQLRRRLPASLAAAAVIMAGAVGLWLWSEQRSLRTWARAEGVPEVLRLVGENQMSAAADLALRVEGILGPDPVLEQLWPRMSTPFRVFTDPPGAAVTYRPYESTDEGWLPLGLTPYETERFPVGAFRFRIRKEGFESIEAVRSFMPSEHVVEIANAGFDYLADPSYIVDVRLAPEGSLPDGMIAVAGGLYGTIPLFGFGNLLPTVVPDFMIDRTEVTNADYREFVDAGGYDDRSHWSESVRNDGETVSWEKATEVYRDSTGRPGPSTWVLGQPPQGTELHPVGGVSWFEADAYCRWRGMSLPTLFHWARATLPSSDPWLPFNPLLARASNFDGDGPLPVGNRDALGISGAHDLAGNVREWVSTAAGTQRYLMGGAWSDPLYFLHDALPTAPWQRADTDGLRCASFPEGEAPEHLRRSIRFPPQDFSVTVTLPDAVFEARRLSYNYDKNLPLADRVDSSTELDWGATEEWVSVDAAYGQRLPIRLHLPTDGEPPYQAIVFFGGGNVLRSNELDDPRAPVDALVRAGRALVEPVYDGTFQRNDGRTLQRISGEGARELFAHWIQDLGRTLDYLERRPDFDGDRVSFMGMSLGAALVPTLLPFVPRFKTAILYSGGFGRTSPQPSIDDQIALAQRIRIPILMLGGENDFNLPIDPHQIALFRAFGTPDEDKSHHIYDAGHWPLPMNEVIRETVDFLDRYMGPVTAQN